MLQNARAHTHTHSHRHTHTQETIYIQESRHIEMLIIFLFIKEQKSLCFTFLCVINTYQKKIKY